MIKFKHFILIILIILISFLLIYLLLKNNGSSKTMYNCVKDNIKSCVIDKNGKYTNCNKCPVLLYNKPFKNAKLSYKNYFLTVDSNNNLLLSNNKYKSLLWSCDEKGNLTTSIKGVEYEICANNTDNTYLVLKKRNINCQLKGKLTEYLTIYNSDLNRHLYAKIGENSKIIWTFSEDPTVFDLS
jgi:hypothetical protein